MSAMDSDLFWMPDVEGILRRRYRILKVVEEMANVGRRKIAGRLDIPLSQVSKDTDVMCAMGLMVSTQGGFSVSREGRARMRRFEQENEARIRCMKLEDKLGDILPGVRIQVYEEQELVDVLSRNIEPGPLKLRNWRALQESMETAEISVLEKKDACVEVAGVILSETGSPLYRIEKKETVGSDWIRSEEGVTAAMLYAVLQYQEPKALILTVDDADAVYEMCMKEREQDAGSCD